MPTTPRPHLSNRHLVATVPTHGGAIAVHPLHADRLRFDVAWSSHRPAMADTGENGSAVIEIQPGVKVRASGFVVRVGGAWEMEAAYLSATLADGRKLTARREAIAADVIREALNTWADAHEVDIAQADDIDRYNRARQVESDIARVETELAELLAKLAAIENDGETHDDDCAIHTTGASSSCECSVYQARPIVPTVATWTKR